MLRRVLFFILALSPLARADELTDAIKVLDAWVTSTVASREQPGVSIGIVRDQQLVWAKGYGHADMAKKKPAAPDTLYRIASISKLFTSTAIMQLRDAGKLQLDDPVAKHLPWFKIRNSYPDSPAITIRQLLTHTSGLPREAMGVNWSDLKMPKREVMIKLLPEQETVYPAETEWKYSNLALSLAGEIVAAVSGEPWHEYVARHILAPLGMKSTKTLPEPGMAGLATGYGRRVPGASRDIEPFLDIEAERPAGNMASNVDDLARFIALQMRTTAAHADAGGAQVLRASTLREMHRIHWLRPDWKSGWGLGFSIRRVNDQVRIGHGGSLPGHRTQIEFAPSEKLGVIVLTNANDGNPVSYVDQAFNVLTPAIKRADTPPAGIAKADPAWEKFVGAYTFKHSDSQVLITNGELVLISPDADNPWESRSILKPAGPNTFRMTVPQGSAGPGGELVRFETDAAGNVTRMSFQNSYMLRKR